MIAANDAHVLRHGAGALQLERDFVRVSGSDAVAFLQGQLSQDVAALAQGGSAFSLLLQPQGKVDAFVRATRTAEDEVVLDTDGGWGGAVADRLNRFKLRVRCDIAPIEWQCVAVRGERSPVVAPPPGLWRVIAETPGVPGFDLVGPEAAIPDGCTRVGAEAYEALRIEVGVPRMGAELDASTIPAAAGVVERSVSFTKGCYTGQELVARIDSRGGKVPRRLRGVVVTAGDSGAGNPRPESVPPVDTIVVVEGREVGTLTSVGWSGLRGAAVALAYVRRDVEAPADAVLRWDGTEVPARVEALPLHP